MPLIRLIYASELASPQDMPKLRDVVEKARVKNDRLGITGFLCFDHRHFLQWLEGDREKVSELYNTIIQDSRHRHIVLLDYGEISARSFSNWSMACMNVADIDAELIYRFSAAPELDAYAMSAASAREFLLALAAERREFLEKAKAEVHGS